MNIIVAWFMLPTNTPGGPEEGASEIVTAAAEV